MNCICISVKVSVDLQQSAQYNEPKALLCSTAIQSKRFASSSYTRKTELTTDRPAAEGHMESMQQSLEQPQQGRRNHKVLGQP